MRTNETTKPPQVGGFELNVQLCNIKTLINEGFMTVNNTLAGSYTVKIKYISMQQAHNLHKALCKLTNV